MQASSDGRVARPSSDRQKRDGSGFQLMWLPAPAAEAYAWPVLRIHLLGRMAVECDGHELAAPSARRAWSLMAYLALTPGPQPRGELAARFWPDVLDSSARASLRSAVWS